MSALALVCIDGCKGSVAPPYVRLEGSSPQIEAAPPSRGHLVVFWATWCEPCRKETPQLRALAADPPSDLAVVVFSHDEEMQVVREFFGEEPHPSLHLRLDTGRAAGKAFGVEALPAAILVVDGRLVARFSGSADWDARGTRELLQKLLTQSQR